MRPTDASWRIEWIVRQARGPAVLHIGCAGQREHRPGFHSSEWLHGRLADRFPDLWGLELDEESVLALRAEGYVNVVEANAESFQLSQKFDTVIAGEVIEHVERPGELLRRAGEHLKPGGRVIISTPYAFSALFVAYAWLKFPRTCGNEEHVLWFCPSTLRALVERAGLVVERLDLIEDYPKNLASRRYRAFRRAYRLARFAIPHRMRATSMCAVLRNA